MRFMRDWLYRHYCGAGRSARYRYIDTAGRWRKRVFQPARPIFALLAIPALVGTVLALDRFWIWFCGVVIGALIGVYMALRDSPPGYIENWRTGYEGEQRTARALAPLRRRGYALLHDIPDRRADTCASKGNLDHVVVSTAGVFLLDSKWLGGQASIEGDTVHVQRRDDEEASYDIPDLARGMRGRAIRLREDIRQHTGVRFVQAVVVFWNDCEKDLVMGDNVVFVHGAHLIDWLEDQPPKIAPGMVARVAEAIKTARPGEHRAWWDRPQTLRLRDRSARVAPAAGVGQRD